MRLKDNVALVTGAGSGIGQAIAIAFAREGARVVVNASTPESTEKSVREIRDLKLNVQGVAADVSKAAEVRAMFAEIDRLHGGLGILVNNAGIAYSSKAYYETAISRIGAQAEEIARNCEISTHLNLMRDLPDEEWERVMAVNLFGVFYCAREALKRMARDGGGSIINVASKAAQAPMGSPGIGHYATSKAGVLGFTRTLAVEVASQRIRVNAIAPGLTDTRMLATARDNPGFRKGMMGRVPLGRLGTPEEIASAAVFLASAESSYMTGQTLNPNGGSFMP